MSFISLHPNYFRSEGFGTLMSHYAMMYCIYRDTGFKPAILDIDFESQKIVSAMKFFNQNDHKFLSHQEVFPNLNKLFVTIKHTEIDTVSWKIADFRSYNYNQIISILNNNNKENNILCLWTLQHSLIKKYLSDIIEILFHFDSQFKQKCMALLPKTSKQIVGVCIRTEYKKISTGHVALSLDFYRTAMNHYNANNSKYLIFSDDIDEAKSMIKSLESNFDIEYTNTMPSAVGLCAMSLCDHIISANSGFSYWSSLLNKNINKQILCPCKFIKSGHSTIADILNYKWYPKEWIALDIC